MFVAQGTIQHGMMKHASVTGIVDVICTKYQKQFRQFCGFSAFGTDSISTLLLAVYAFFNLTSCLDFH
jgi:hypothetical protein